MNRKPYPDGQAALKSIGRVVPVQTFELISCPDASELARAAAGAWLDDIIACGNEDRPYLVALSGGRIANLLFSSFASQARARSSNLDRTHFFWADERCVPPTDEESNYRVAKSVLFDPLGTPGKLIHRIPGEDPPATAARLAESELRELASCDGAGQPRFDMILLGMGEDGHVASLFPGETDGLICDPTVYRVVENSPKPPSRRITLGYPVIAAARKVWVLISGAGKESALRKSLEDSNSTPLGRVLHYRPATRILTDIDCAQSQ